MDWTALIGKVYELITIYGIRVIGALVILVIGRWVAKGIALFIKRLMTNRKTDETLVGFIADLSYVALLAFVIIAALNQLGIQTASFIAVLGAAGLAVGLALQGSLSNFAAGVLMIIFKPLRVGDFVEAGGTAGVVEEVQIFTTVLKTPDNKMIIVPNSKIMGDNIINYSAKGTRRVDLVFSIAYSDDIDTARRVILETAENDSRVQGDPKPVALVSELADSSVNLTLRAWTSANDYWDVYFDMIEKVKKSFDIQGITIPFPQRDVHYYEHKKFVQLQPEMTAKN